MRRSTAAAMLSAALLASASAAEAGVYTDDLSKCLVKSAGVDDQTALVVWVFAAMSAHPAVRSYSTMSTVQRDAITKKAGELVQRLMTVDCRAETVASLKYEGQAAISAAFNVLGQVAMRGLMGHPDVAQSMQGLGAGIDSSKFEALAKEAGAAEPLTPDRK